MVVVAAAVGITLAVTGGGSSSSGTGSGGTPSLKLAALSTLGSLEAGPASGPTGPEGVPIPSVTPLTSTATKATGRKVDGISCQTSEQMLFHIHAHLTVFVNGSAAPGPGRASGSRRQGPEHRRRARSSASGKCFYWLHTHAADGIIHIESPMHRTYTLGDFFDEWGQPLGPNQVGPVKGHVTAIYNGKVYQGNPRDIPLNAHAQIQLEVGTPAGRPGIDHLAQRPVAGSGDGPPGSHRALISWADAMGDPASARQAARPLLPRGRTARLPCWRPGAWW